MSVKCSKCDQDIAQTKDSFKCAGCSGCFHPVCSGTDPTAKVSTRKNWRCGDCKDPGQTAILEAIAASREEISSKVDKLEKSTMEQLRKMEENISKVTKDVGSLQSAFNDLKQSVKSTDSSVNSLKEENTLLKKEVLSLKADMEDLQQHTRKSNMIISGVPLTKGENVFNVLANIATVLDIKGYSYDISAAHRLPQKNREGVHPLIVVCFTSRLMKRDWMAARKNFGTLTAKHLNSTFPDSRIYFNDHMTPNTRSIFNRGRELVKAKKLTAVWLSDCRVLVRKTERGAAIRVRSLADLDQLLPSPPETIK